MRPVDVVAVSLYVLFAALVPPKRYVLLAMELQRHVIPVFVVAAVLASLMAVSQVVIRSSNLCIHIFCFKSL